MPAELAMEPLSPVQPLIGENIDLPRPCGGGAQLPADVPERLAARGQETVLLVDDDPAVLNLVVRMVKAQGYTVLAAGSPGEAVSLAREHASEIHLLLTDVVMPEMNGQTLAQKLVALYPRLKRIFMSGYTADILGPHGVMEEGVHFIQKPFSGKELVAKFREALDSGSG